jgi:hypothetical protein
VSLNRGPAVMSLYTEVLSFIWRFCPLYRGWSSFCHVIC